MKYLSTKTFGHDRGYSVAFRQWRATSHCNQIHGYSLQFAFVFEAKELDNRRWVVDFGSLGPIKEKLDHVFDHTTVIAEDDPEKEILMKLQERGVARIITLPDVGCERFAEYVYNFTEHWLETVDAYRGRVRLRSVEVREHAGNSGIYEISHE